MTGKVMVPVPAELFDQVRQLVQHVVEGVAVSPALPRLVRAQLDELSAVLDDVREVSSRRLLDLAVSSALSTPEQWAPHVWGKLAAQAVEVERNEREAELHARDVEARSALADAERRSALVASRMNRSAEPETSTLADRCPRCRHTVNDHWGADAEHTVHPSFIGCSVFDEDRKLCSCTLSAEEVAEKVAKNAAGGVPAQLELPTAAMLLHEHENAPAWLIDLLDAAAIGEQVDCRQLADRAAPTWVVDRVVATRQVMRENEQGATT